MTTSGNTEPDVRFEIGHDHVPEERRFSDAALSEHCEVPQACRFAELNDRLNISFQCAEKNAHRLEG